MKQCKGNMSVGLVIGLGFLAVLLLVTFALFRSYVAAYDYGNATEAELKSIKENNENILAQYGQKVLEAAQVPKQMANDLNKVMSNALTARYGDEGSKATWQWLKEQNPQLDPTLYQNIQRIIESGRNEFQTNQTRLVDVKRQYETKLGSFWDGMLLKFAGYPKIDLTQYRIVSTSRAKEAFEKGIEDAPLKIAD